jgi:hypothetical protein
VTELAVGASAPHTHNVMSFLSYLTEPLLIPPLLLITLCLAAFVLGMAALGAWRTWRSRHECPQCGSIWTYEQPPTQGDAGAEG